MILSRIRTNQKVGRRPFRAQTDRLYFTQNDITHQRSADGYTVKLSIGGGNPHWASDLEIDCFELRAVGLPWSVLRLVFLAFDGRRPAPAAIAARHVPLRALDLIVRMLHTPVALRSRTPARPG